MLYYIDEVFSGDLRISAQNGPDFSHYIGQGIHQNHVAKKGAQITGFPRLKVNA